MKKSAPEAAKGPGAEGRLEIRQPDGLAGQRQD